jgi:hypothetical protein
MTTPDTATLGTGTWEISAQVTCLRSGGAGYSTVTLYNATNNVGIKSHSSQLNADCPVSIEINALIQVGATPVDIQVYWGSGALVTLKPDFNVPGCTGNMPSGGTEHATWFYGHLVYQ